MSDAFQPLMAKILRAKKHIKDLSDDLDAFSNSYRDDLVRFEDDQETRERSYYVTSVPDIPMEITTIVGDILHNLRSALDHLAWQLVLNARNEPNEHTYFPIADNAEKYFKLNSRNNIKPEDRDAIDALEPYREGKNDILWRLHRLNIIDKHRMLITACLTYRAHGMLPSESESMRQQPHSIRIFNESMRLQ
jgi:hypothetical protein